MPSEWRTLSVEEMAEVIGGGTPKTTVPSYWNGSVPWITPRDMSNHHGRYIDGGERMLSDDGLASSSARLLPAGTVVLTTRAPVGYVAIARRPLATNQGFRSLVPKPGFVAEYLYYVLSTSTEYLRQHAGGTTFQELAGSTLKRLTFRVPDETTQRRIASILGSLDDKIELNRRMNRTLEKMAAAVFKSWFIDFDPVRAKAEGRDPGLPADIADLFPDAFEDSTLGPIPAGWQPGVLGDVAESPRRGVKPSEVPPNTPYIGLEHMPRCCIALDVWGRVDEVASGKSQFEEGEILFGKLRPYFHKVGIAPVDGVCSTDIVVIAPKAEHWRGYVVSLVSSKAFVDYTDAHSAGTKMPRTNWTDMSRYPLALPPEPLVKAFQDHVTALHKRIGVNVRQNRRLAGLRDTLLPKLLSGEVEVPKAEAAVEEVR